MVIKIALILLLLGAPVGAHDVPIEQIVRDAIDEITISGVDLARERLADSLIVIGELWNFPTLVGTIPAHRDTTRWYVKEIKQKCDTTHKWVRRCRLICSGSAKRTMGCIPKIKCVDDTVWAEKVSLYKTEYEVCKIRGHIATDGVFIRYWDNDYVCKYCGTRYRVWPQGDKIEEMKE